MHLMILDIVAIKSSPSISQYGDNIGNHTIMLCISMDHIIHRICSILPWGECTWRVKYEEKKIDTPHQQQPKQLQKSICLLKMKYCIMILGRSMAAVVVGWLHLFIFLLYFSGYMVQILWVCRIYSREWAWIKKLIKIFMIEIFFVRMMSTWFLFNALSSLFNGDVESKKSEFIIWIIHTMKCKYEYESGDRDWMKRKR